MIIALIYIRLTLSVAKVFSSILSSILVARLVAEYDLIYPNTHFIVSWLRHVFFLFIWPLLGEEATKNSVVDIKLGAYKASYLLPQFY